MLANFLHLFHKTSAINATLISLLIAGVGTGLLYIFLYYVLRPTFRRFERDIAIVSLNVSTNPALIVFSLLSLKFSFELLSSVKIAKVIDRTLISVVVIVISYWLVQIFNQVFIYYVKDYTQKSEAMWDDVLLPILSAVVPVMTYITGGVLVLNTFGVNLTGIWVTLGGATFVLGFALQDILANFFSGIVLLVDTPFRFGDILLLEDGSIGMLRRIGIRVTHLYMFSSHSDVYIPNSVLQGQKLTNLSRPTTLYYHSIVVEIPPECKIPESQQLIREIVLAHPDTIGDVDEKLAVVDNYYNGEDSPPELLKQQELGKERLMAEQEVDFKLEEIGQALEALVVTMQFAEKGGITSDEIENVKQEYQAILELMGFELIDDGNNRGGLDFEENSEEGLLELIRQWYRLLIRDPNLQEEDQYFISEEWERKIGLLKRRAHRLAQKIFNTQADETRLDDSVQELIKWLKEKLKVPRKKWQDPQIRMIGMNHAEALIYLEMEVTFFVDDIKLEEGKRGDRVRSQIYQEIFRHLQNTYLKWNGISAAEEEVASNGNAADNTVVNQNGVSSLVQTALDPTTARQGFAFYLSVGRNQSALKSGKPAKK